MGRKKIYPYSHIRNCEVCGAIFIRVVKNVSQVRCGFTCSDKCKKKRTRMRVDQGITAPGRPRKYPVEDKNAISKTAPKSQKKSSSIPMPTEFEKQFYNW